MDLKEVDILGDSIQDHWYYVAKARAMRRFLTGIKVPEVLDVGAGSGIFSRHLLDAGICDTAICLDPNYPDEHTDYHHGKKIQFIKRTEKSALKLILMMDVLEHIEDDVAFLQEYASLLDDDGLILITVPAFQFVWSGHDVFLEHHRRYTIDQLESTLNKAGLSPIKSRYFFGILFPAVAASRMFNRHLLARGEVAPKSELKLYPGWLNRALTVLHDIERNTIFDVNRAFGLSLFCLCRKNRQT
jgi:SAM-dependent methyltransferase